MKVILNRLKEPSTWSGLGLLAALFGVNPTTYNAVAVAISGVAGAAAVLLPEKL